MDEEKRQEALEKLKNAKPLEAAQILKDMEFYDKTTAQEVIDSVYQEFESGDNMVNQVVIPVFTSVVDGLMEGTSFGRGMRKKGLTSTRIVNDCKNFSYDGAQNFGGDANAYDEYKNAQVYTEKYAEEVRGEYERSEFEDKTAMNRYKDDKVKDNDGRKNLQDEYTKKRNITAYQKNPDERRNDPKHSYQAEPDHIIPLKTLHDQFKGNYALSDEDIKRIANQESNLALTNSKLNRKKQDKSNSEFIKEQEEKEKNGEEYYFLSEETKKTMLEKEAEAKAAIEGGFVDTVLGNFAPEVQLEREKAAAVKKEEAKLGRELTQEEKEKVYSKVQNTEKYSVNDTVLKNLMGKGTPDEKEVSAAYKKAEAKLGRKLTNDEKNKINSDLAKEKRNEILFGKKKEDGDKNKDDTGNEKKKKEEQSNNKANGGLVGDAADQAKDYAVGNLIMFIVKPIYYEVSDIFRNGLKSGVGASSGLEAIAIRFGRVRDYVIANAKTFLGDSVWEFVKGFISSFIEGIINLFVGAFKQVLKIIKEGIKVFVQSVKILFGEESKKMSAAEKGDAIIKLLGGSIIALSGVAIEALLNKIGIGDPWSVILSTIISGVASALFMYLLDKADIFSAKAEKRHERIMEVFNMKIEDIDKATKEFDDVAFATLKNQRIEFEEIRNDIKESIKANDIDSINEGLYKMAEFMGVDIPYKTTEEFCDYIDSNPVIYL